MIQYKMNCRRKFCITSKNKKILKNKGMTSRIYQRSSTLSSDGRSTIFSKSSSHDFFKHLSLDNLKPKKLSKKSWTSASMSFLSNMENMITAMKSIRKKFTDFNSAAAL